MAVLEGNIELLGPLVLALSRSDRNLDVAQAFLKLHQDGIRVILAGEFTETMLEQLGADSTNPAKLVLGEQDLLLTEDEAVDLAAGRLELGEIRRLLLASGGVYELFMASLYQRLGLPVRAVPSPTGWRLPAGHERPVAPEALLDVLIEKQDWVRAAEVAVTSVPQRAAEVLIEASHVFHERGLHKRLWRLLEHLPQHTKGRPEMLFWRLSAAVRLGRKDELKREVEAHLSLSEAPDLRALYAGVFLHPDEARRETKRGRRSTGYSANPLPTWSFFSLTRPRGQGCSVRPSASPSGRGGPMRWLEMRARLLRG